MSEELSSADAIKVCNCELQTTKQCFCWCIFI